MKQKIDEDWEKELDNLKMIHVTPSYIAIGCAKEYANWKQFNGDFQYWKDKILKPFIRQLLTKKIAEGRAAKSSLKK